MKNKPIFILATFLYKYFPFLYKQLYFKFKANQDAYEIELMKRFIKKGDILLDIGANIGFYTTVFSKLAGRYGKVYCFEPDPGNSNFLRSNTKKFQNVTLIPKAVSEKKGTLTFYTSHRLNVDHRSYKPEKFNNSFEVESISIDEFINGKFDVNFIKMDIQGAEYGALKGMVNTLRKNDAILLMEIWPYGLKLAGSSVEEVVSYINKLKYKVYSLNNMKLRRISEKSVKQFGLKEEDYYNVIASKKKLV